MYTKLSFISNERWAFEKNEFYNLIWNNNTLELYYNSDEPLPAYCVPDLSEEITDDTWKKIYGEYFMHLIPVLTDDIVLDLLEEESIVQSDREWDLREEYDTDYFYDDVSDKQTDEIILF